MLVNMIKICSITMKDGIERHHREFPSNVSLYREVIPFVKMIEDIYDSVSVWAINQDEVKIRKLWDQSCNMKEFEVRFVRVSVAGIWIEIHPKLLIRGDVIKMFEPDGTPIQMFSLDSDPCYVAVVNSLYTDENGLCNLVLS